MGGSQQAYKVLGIVMPSVAQNHSPWGDELREGYCAIVAPEHLAIGYHVTEKGVAHQGLGIVIVTES